MKRTLQQRQSEQSILSIESIGYDEWGDSATTKEKLQDPTDKPS